MTEQEGAVGLSDKEMGLLKKAVSKVEDGEHYRYKNYAINVMNTALDFQMNYSVVETALNYFIENHNYKSHGKLVAHVNRYPNTKPGNLRLARNLWNNNHWSRACFLRTILTHFDSIGVRGQKSLEKWAKNADFEQDVKGKIKTKEHSVGIAIFKWMQVKCGVNTVKPDVHILNFVSEAVKRRVSPEEAVDGIVLVAKQLKRKAYRIDSAIWNMGRQG
jgi:hypothetical protein